MNWVLKHAIEGKVQGTIRLGRKRREQLDDVILLEIERCSTGSFFLENTLWKRLWTCLKITR